MILPEKNFLFNKNLKTSKEIKLTNSNDAGNSKPSQRSINKSKRQRRPLRVALINAGHREQQALEHCCSEHWSGGQLQCITWWDEFELKKDIQALEQSMDCFIIGTDDQTMHPFALLEQLKCLKVKTPILLVDTTKIIEKQTWLYAFDLGVRIYSQDWPNHQVLKNLTKLLIYHPSIYFVETDGLKTKIDLKGFPWSSFSRLTRLEENFIHHLFDQQFEDYNNSEQDKMIWSLLFEKLGVYNQVSVAILSLHSRLVMKKL